MKNMTNIASLRKRQRRGRNDLVQPMERKEMKAEKETERWRHKGRDKYGFQLELQHITEGERERGSQQRGKQYIGYF